MAAASESTFEQHCEATVVPQSTRGSNVSNDLSAVSSPTITWSYSVPTPCTLKDEVLSLIDNRCLRASAHLDEYSDDKSQTKDDHDDRGDMTSIDEKKGYQSVECHCQQENIDEIENLKTKLIACELEINQLTEFKAMADCQQKQNSSLVEEMKKLNEKITKYEALIKRLEDEKKKGHRERKRQMNRMTRKVKTLSDALRNKEDLIIPGLMEQIKEKDAALDQSEDTLTKVQENVGILTEKFNRCNDDLTTTTEERDILTSELKSHISDTGRLTNEMAEVLNVRECMAKEYYREKCDLVQRIAKLEDEVRRKQHMVDRLVSRVESFEKEALAVTIEDPPIATEHPQRMEIIGRWFRARLGERWQLKISVAVVMIVVVVLLALSVLGILMNRRRP